MEQKQNKVYKNETFFKRFRALCYDSKKTQDELGAIFGVSRPTVAGWLIGKGTPNIKSLVKISQHFNVSTDYLLGLTDTSSPDVTARAAVQYTGLSEEAVKWLHIGLDDFECDGVGVSTEDKKQNLKAASKMIQSRAFTKIIQNLVDVEREAYLERLLEILEERYSECDLPVEDPDFHYANRADRDVVAATLLHVFDTEHKEWKEVAQKSPLEMDDNELSGDVTQALLNARDANERHQFHAAKAFTSYIDQIVKASYKRADQRFEKK